MTERLRVREIGDDEGQRLVRIIRRGSAARPRPEYRGTGGFTGLAGGAA